MCIRDRSNSKLTTILLCKNKLIVFQCKALYRIIFPYSSVSDYLLYLSSSICLFYTSRCVSETDVIPEIVPASSSILSISCIYSARTLDIVRSNAVIWLNWAGLPPSLPGIFQPSSYAVSYTHLDVYKRQTWYVGHPHQFSKY